MPSHTRRLSLLCVPALSIIIAAGAAVLFSPAPAPAQPRERGEHGERGEKGDREPINVGRAMKGIGRSLKELQANISDASKSAENLKLVERMQRLCLDCKVAGTPEDILSKAKTDAEKTAMKATYRQHLVKLMRGLLDTEEHLAAGKLDVAKGDVAALVLIRDEAHKAVDAD